MPFYKKILSNRVRIIQLIRNHEIPILSSCVVPKTSAYMAQDFSLRRADFLQTDSIEQITIAEGASKGPENDFEHGSTNMTSSTNDCPTACPSIPAAAPSPSVRAAVSAVLTSHFGPTKGQIIPFDLELLGE